MKKKVLLILPVLFALLLGVYYVNDSGGNNVTAGLNAIAEPEATTAEISTEESSTEETTTEEQTTVESTTVESTTEESTTAETTTEETTTEEPTTAEPTTEETTAVVTTTEATTAKAVGTDYVLNSNTMKFHHTWCSSAGDIASWNRIDFNGTRAEVIAKGYVPCKRCKP